MNWHINVPMTEKGAASLKAGDYAYLTGTIYTVRGATHRRMNRALDRREALPSDIEGSIIYYMGPSPTREGEPINSVGPTIANHMDKYTPQLLGLDMRAMIGKGKRSRDVMGAIVYGGTVYFAAVEGAGATLSRRILSSEIAMYGDLGTETVRKLTIQDFSVVVVVDTFDNNLCGTAIKKLCTL